jgi:hypothetical protein
VDADSCTARIFSKRGGEVARPCLTTTFFHSQEEEPLDGMKRRKGRIDVYPAYKDRSSTIKEEQKQGGKVEENKENKEKQKKQ